MTSEEQALIRHYELLTKQYRELQEAATDSDTRIISAALADEATEAEAELRKRAGRTNLG